MLMSRERSDHWANTVQIFTREEAKKLVEEDPKRTWPLVPANVKIQLKDRVNELLANENIPTIQDDDILSWRMSLAVRDAIVSAGTCSLC